MSTLDVLVGARHRLNKGWCQFTEATTTTGAPTDALDATAQAFCPYGACFAITGNWKDAIQVLDLVALGLPDIYSRACDLISYNDRESTTQSDVLALFDKAISHQLAISEA